MSEKIFVQIASYRDPELVPTLKDALVNATYSDRVIFGICRQYHPDDKFDDLREFSQYPNFKILDVPYTDTKGVCWARNQIQQLYSGEEYTLQIDSHMRFAQGWDETLIGWIKQLQESGIPKPLLTAYVPSYNPTNDPAERVMEPWRLAFDRFIPEGAVFFIPETIPNWESKTRPVPSRFFSAHFTFTLGQFCEEVPHDPNYYFHGEEISLAVRSYTHGYDLFHPHRVVIWHEYTREGRTKQWDDDKDWVNKNNSSHARNRSLFNMGENGGYDFGKYGFGKERTLRDYEKYAGVLFEDRAIQRYTLDKHYPPNPYNFKSEEDWKKSFLRIFRHCIDLGFDQFPENDYDFWVVAFHSSKTDGSIDDTPAGTMFRQDADEDEIAGLLATKGKELYIKLWRQFETEEIPQWWVVWPHSRSKGFLDRIIGKL